MSCVSGKKLNSCFCILRICYCFKPQCDYKSEEALRASTHGRRYIDSIRVVDSLNELKQDFDLLAAFSARGSSIRSPISLENFTSLSEINDNSKSLGLVFGRESDGLTNDETTLCDFVVKFVYLVLFL